MRRVERTTQEAQRYLQTSYPIGVNGTYSAPQNPSHFMDEKALAVRPFSTRDTANTQPLKEFHNQLEFGIASTDSDKIGSGLIQEQSRGVTREPFG